MAVALLVTYPAAAGARFDRGYYTATHLPLVEAQWAPHRLTGAQAMFPDGDDAPILAAALLTFRDAAARDAALGSAEAATVFGDVANFTDSAPAAQPLTIA